MARVSIVLALFLSAISSEAVRSDKEENSKGGQTDVGKSKEVYTTQHEGKALTDAVVDVKDEADAEATNNTTAGVEESETENVKKVHPGQNYDWQLTAEDSNCQPAKADKIEKFGRVRNLVACQAKTLANKDCGSKIWFKITKGKKTNKCGCMKSGKESRCNTQYSKLSNVYERTNKAEYSDDRTQSFFGSASGAGPSQREHTGRTSPPASRAYQSKDTEFPYDEYHVGPNDTEDEFRDDESQVYQSKGTGGSWGRGNNKGGWARSSHDMYGVNATFTTDRCARGCKPRCRFRGGYDAEHCKCVMFGQCGECHESCGVACEMTEAAMQCKKV